MTTLDIGALPEACIVGLAAEDDEAVLRALADRAIQAGKARLTFADALVARERVSPTALPTAVPVAIPHADAEHVLAGGFAVATLARPVPFGVMGTDSEQIDVDIVVALLVTDPHGQIGVLTTLIDVFQRAGWDEGLRAASSPGALASAFDRLLAQP